jgi:protoporphyrinogen oxidase
MENVAVIGAGPAGCYAAYRLRKQGKRVVVFEAQAAIGGRTQSYRHNGYTLDTGAAFITNFYPITQRLIRQLNLSDQRLAIERITALTREGQIAQLQLGSAKSFLQYPFLSPTEKAKIALHISKLVARRFQFSLTDLKQLAKQDDETIANYTRRVLSENIYQSVVRPGVEPFWYFSCEVVSRALYLALSAYAPDAKFYVFNDGIDRLCHALVSGCEVVVGQHIVGLEAQAEGFRLAVAGGSAISDVFDHVVMATTASVAQTITAGLGEKWVSEEQRQFLQSQTYVSNLHCVFQADQFDRDFSAFSLFPCGAGTHSVAAVSFNSAKCAQLSERNQELISIYLGSEYSAQLLEEFNRLGCDGANYYADQDFAQALSPITGVMATVYEKALSLCPALPSASQVKPFFCAARQEAIPVHAVGRYRSALRFQEQQRLRLKGLSSRRSRRQVSGGAGNEGVTPTLSFVGDYLATATVEGALASVEALF